MADDFEYISRSRLEYRDGYRNAYLGEVAEPVVYGVQGALREYYAGLRLGHTVYTQTGSLDAYAAAVERATAFLERAEVIAVDLGAPECAIRPFPED